MEKFNPNKKNWEPLFDDTVIKYGPAPKDLEKPEIPELPKSVAGHINQSLEKMTTFEEKEDEFIFEHLARRYGSVTSLIEEIEAIMKGEDK